jgi:phosphatidate cytidylyltransferase
VKNRIIAAVVGLALVIPILRAGGVWVLGLVAVVVAVGMDEWAGMVAGTGEGAAARRLRARLVLIPTGVAAFLVVATGAAVPLPALLLAVVGVGFLVPMFAEADVHRAGDEAVKNVAGLVYVPLLLAPLVLIRERADGLWMVAFLLAATWLGDTGAYFAGRFFGRHKLFPRVSPNKTVEGAVGGLVLSAFGSAALARAAGLPFSWAEAVVLGAVLDVAGIVGDLAESLLKRAWGVKNSGWIMPGHGGILDRIDSLLFTAPLLWTWLALR